MLGAQNEGQVANTVTTYRVIGTAHVMMYVRIIDYLISIPAIEYIVTGKFNDRRVRRRTSEMMLGDLRR